MAGLATPVFESDLNDGSVIWRWLHRLGDLSQRALMHWKKAKYDPEMVARLTRLRDAPSARVFDTPEEMMTWLNHQR
jgi:hypothetical protein